ncbi:MAG: hypothetical protein ACR2P8_06385 [Myxococcota bacterium]
MSANRWDPVWPLLGALLFAALLLPNLAHPLFWADEAETAMFGRRVLEYGYPKVHGRRNVVYQFGPNIAVGVKEGPDAYIGTTWGQFYFAAPGLVWARGSPDPYTRTFRARLPFALAGAAGVGLWLAALLPVFAGDRPRQLRFAGAYLLCAALSISLLLHLREVRYYALVVLLGGAIFRVHLGYLVYQRVGFGRWTAELALLLFLLFHTFFQAFFAFGALLGLERLVAIWRGRGCWRELAPFAAAGLAVLPFLWWFEILSTASAFAESFRFSAAGWASNLRDVAGHFLRHEFLGPALVCRLAALATGAGSPAGRRVAGGLALFALGFVLLGCVNPLALERYFVVLSPLVTGVFLLDAFALVARFSSAARPAAALVTVAALILGTVALRAPAFTATRGRLHELATPYRGPLDHAIPYLLAEYERPEQLVIATNYEEYAFMYYLGSHVIVGLSGNNRLSDRRQSADVIVPRRRWPASLRELMPHLQKGGYREQRFPVEDVHFNNVPALSRSRFIPAPHRFESPASDDPEKQLVLFLRAPDEVERGGASPAAIGSRGGG